MRSPVLSVALYIVGLPLGVNPLDGPHHVASGRVAEFFFFTAD